MCYSWWVLSSLSIVERLEWISAYKLQVPSCAHPNVRKEAPYYVVARARSRLMQSGVGWVSVLRAAQEFILSCQDPEKGGISDRPDDMADVFHTFFGIAGLSLMGKGPPINSITASAAPHCDSCGVVEGSAQVDAHNAAAR